MNPPVFPGLDALLNLISHLVKRPKFKVRSGDNERNGDIVLPLICIVQDHESGLLKAVKDRLRAGGTVGDQQQGSSRPIPSAWVDARSPKPVGDTNEQMEKKDRMSLSVPMLPVLNAAAFDLTEGSFGRRQSLTFRHFELVDFLTRLEVPAGEPERGRRIMRLLSKRFPSRPWGRGMGLLDLILGVAEWLSGLYLTVAVQVMRVMAPKSSLVLRLESRWLLAQPFNTPSHSDGFAAFADRLTPARRHENNEEQIKLLLVHAFLQDLRVAYRRRRRLGYRREGGRRTAHVTLCLDGVDEHNGGWELLRLINDLRNQLGEIDPLLVLATLDPATARRVGTEPAPVGSAQAAYEKWTKNLPVKRQRWADDARFILLRLPESGREEPSYEDNSVWSRWHITRGPVPLGARLGVLELAMAVVVALALIGPARAGFDYQAAGCGFFSGFSDEVPGYPNAPVQAYDRDGLHECIGYSDGGLVFGSHDHLVAAQKRVFEQNSKADEIAQANPERFTVRIIYFAGLTHGKQRPEAADSVADEIDGLVLQQRRANIPHATGPLLKVIVANGGWEMRAASYVADHFLAPLLAQDRSIVAVVGMERTIEETEKAIRRLGAEGVPVIGTTLTGTSLRDISPLYFQLVPDNTRLAELVRDYARLAGVTKISIYGPRDPLSDTYVASLLQQFTTPTVGVAMPQVEPKFWDTSPNQLKSECDKPDSKTMVFLASRATDFASFVRAVTAECSTDRLPIIVASDDFSRLVDDRTQRAQLGVSHVRVAYIGLAGMVVIAGSKCLKGEPTGQQALNDFCGHYRTLADAAELWPSELTALTYDAAGVVLNAVQKSGTGPLNRAAVGQALRDYDYQGVTARYSFTQSRIPQNRNLTILEIDNVGDPASAPRCVFLLGDRPYADREPHPTTNCPIETVARP